MQVAIIVRGVESIRIVEQYSAPILLALAAALLAWALSAAGGVGPMLSSPSQAGPGGVLGPLLRWIPEPRRLRWQCAVLLFVLWPVPAAIGCCRWLLGRVPAAGR
jgi:hypothetical protein